MGAVTPHAGTTQTVCTVQVGPADTREIRLVVQCMWTWQPLYGSVSSALTPPPHTHTFFTRLLPGNSFPTQGNFLCCCACCLLLNACLHVLTTYSLTATHPCDSLDYPQPTWKHIPSRFTQDSNLTWVAGASAHSTISCAIASPNAVCDTNGVTDAHCSYY